MARKALLSVAPEGVDTDRKFPRASIAVLAISFAARAVAGTVAVPAKPTAVEVSAPVETSVLQAAIDRISASGGGRVVVPRGEWTIGTVWLRDGVELHLPEGAVLKGSANLADYNAPDAYPQNWGSKAEGWSAKHLIIAHEVRSVALTGKGVIDGNAGAFMAEETPQMRKGDYTWRHGYLNAKDREHQGRPGQGIVFIESRDIRISGVTMRNMPMWTCFLHGCENAAIDGVTISNDLRHANTDGFDIDSCRNVTVANCTITTGDDAFAIRGDNGRLGDRTRVCENILITNCTCACSASGVRIGVGAGAIRKVTFRDIRFKEAGHGLLVQSCYPQAKYRGVDISDIVFENIEIGDCAHAILVTAGTDKADAVLENVTFRNVTARTSGCVIVEGAGKVRPKNIVFDGLDLTLVSPIRPRTEKSDWQVVGAANRLEAAVVRERCDGVGVSRLRITRDPAIGAERAKDVLDLSREGRRGSAAADDFTFYCVEPFSPGTERQLAAEIVELKARTGFDLVLYCLSLHPEGRPAMKKAEHLIGSYRTLKKELEDSGVRLGVLVQATLGHWPRTDGDEEPWMRSVTIEGKVKRVCPMDPGCRAYVAAVMESLAREKPAFVLLDDDVHASGAFGVECFCAHHTAAFNAANGTDYTPEGFRAAVRDSRPGDALSQKFLAFQRAFVNDLVDRVRAALDRVDPTIPSGACTPYLEHRFAGETARRLAAKGQAPVLRIDNSLYGGRRIADFPDCVAHTQAMVDHWRKSVPVLLDESDCFPHNRYSLSAVLLDLKLQSAAFNGLAGSKLWFANGHKGAFPVSRRYTDMLAAHRGLYSAIMRATQETRLTGLVAPTVGGRRPWHWSMPCEAFAPTDSWPTRMCAAFGIPFVFRGTVGRDEICALGGEQTVSALSDAELEALFRGTVLVDGAAALTLTERGLSRLLGAKAERTKPLYNSERDVATGVVYPFSRKDETPQLTPLAKGARTLTELCYSPYEGSPDVTPVAPGALLLENALGGRVLVTAYFATGFAWEWPQTDPRKAWLLRLLGELGWNGFASLADQDVTLLERTAADGSTLLALFNLGYDPLESVRLRVPRVPVRVERMDAHGVWRPVGFTVLPSGGIDVKTGRIACSEAVMLRMAESR